MQEAWSEFADLLQVEGQIWRHGRLAGPAAEAAGGRERQAEANAGGNAGPAICAARLLMIETLPLIHRQLHRWRRPFSIRVRHDRLRLSTTEAAVLHSAA